MKFTPVLFDNVEIFQQMYVRYIVNDLKRYSSCYQARNPTEWDLAQEAFDYYAVSDFDINLVRNDFGDYMGFFITCTSASQFCPEGSDFHIAEFYVERDFRMLGVGTDALDKLLKDKKGKVVSLHILERNSPALHFWNKIFSIHADSLPVVPTMEGELGLYRFTVK